MLHYQEAVELACHARQCSSRSHCSEIVRSERERCATNEISQTLSSAQAGRIISGATLSGTGFSVSGLTFPYTLPAGGSASLSITFAPSATGTENATLSLSSNASDPSVGVSLTGSGTTSSGTLGVTPGSMSFGSVTIGSTQTQSGSVTASGGSVTLSSASSSNSVFTLGGLTLPVTLAAGQSVPFTVTFAPTTSGTASANVSFFTSTSTSPWKLPAAQVRASNTSSICPGMRARPPQSRDTTCIGEP